MDEDIKVLLVEKVYKEDKLESKILVVEIMYEEDKDCIFVVDRYLS